MDVVKYFGELRGDAIFLKIHRGSKSVYSTSNICVSVMQYRAARNPFMRSRVGCEYFLHVSGGS